MNIYPAVKGHTLLVPKNHIGWMKDADDAVVSSIFVLAKQLMEKIRIGLSCDYVQINVIGEEIQHFHIHLIPRYLNQKIGGWDIIPVTEEEIQTYANKIKG
jgi:histidine triad (HIT) family protein